MIEQALRDVDVFVRLGREERRALAHAIVAELGEGWSAAEPSEALDALPLRHAPTGFELVVVPGGSFEMGLTEGDLAELRSLIPPEDADPIAALEAQCEDMRPVRRVRVNPFVIGRACLSHQDVERLSGGRFQGIYCYSLRWTEARELAQAQGFRLPSEAELEWLARDGGRFHSTLDAARRMPEIKGDSSRLKSRFGVMELWDFQWAEDDYHPSYEGAPTTSVPWMNGAGTGVARSLSMPELVNEPHQLVGLLAALRTDETQRKAMVRFARSLASFEGRS